MFSVCDVSDFPNTLRRDFIVYDDYSLPAAHAAGLIGLTPQKFRTRYPTYTRENAKPAVYRGHNNREIKRCISFSNFATVLKLERWSSSATEKVLFHLHQALGANTYDPQHLPAK